MTGTPHLVLIGLMGAGKTTVGRRCARKLDRALVDTDDVVVAQAGMTIDDIFRHAGGEARFRELERAAIADIVASPAPLVIATGGGAVLDPENRKSLRANAVVVWLRAPVDVLAERVGDGNVRPLLHGDPRAALARLDKLREPAYEATAHRVVETAGKTLDEVTDAVLDAYEVVSVR
jgi:shikimate kinase